MRDTFLLIVVLVALNVGLVFKIDTIFVAEVIPIGTTGIV
jgi:hypothetical protein